MKEEQSFGPVLHKYTAKDAVSDGTFVALGRIGEIPVYATANCFIRAGLDDPIQRHGVVLEAIEALKRPDPEDTHWRLRVLHKGKAADYDCLWVVLNDEGLTIMFPEDY